jgi:Protein of unknown function (DUF1592)/Protein of unknown function (DUF1588)/Protein of unknown function (DUF1587)/Protein of unknown function (DUF1585)/Protein of unknown function (DUF1595)
MGELQLEEAMFRSSTSALALGIAVVGAFFWRSTVVPAETPLSPTTAPFDQHMVWGTWKKYCDSCHFGPKARGNVNLETLDLANLNNNGATWEKVLRKLRGREMPPPGALRPDEATYKGLVSAITTERDRLADTRPTPGRPTLHRLNRAEYGNSVRDLLGLQIDVSELLPPDDSGYGFDNIGDVLTVSPELLERYLLASGKVARQAVGDTKIPPGYQTYTVAHGLKQDDRMADGLQIGTRGGTVVEHLFPVDGEYEIAVELQRGRAGELLGNGRERKLSLRLDDQAIHDDFTIPANRGRRADINTQVNHDTEQGYKVRMPVKAGIHVISAAFEKDTVLPEGILFRQRFDAIQSYFEGVGAISISGPYNVQGPGDTASREKIFVCHPAGASDEMPCAEKILNNIAHHAYRRPVAADDMPALLALYKQGAEAGGFEQGIRLALQKILVSPNFLFRVELDPTDVLPGGVRQVSDIELASRLSFFLWSSIPDDKLLAIAESGKLRDPSVLEGQVRRMLADPRSQALVQNFAGQWLFLRNIPAVQPDPAAFPTWDENLRQAMRKETELWLESQMRDDRSVVDLLTTDYTFVNERLAEHYGMKDVWGNEFRRVTVEDPRRRGLLGQASIMAVTSYPNRTAPTVRGKWVLEQLLGTPPPPPPPNVPFLKEDAAHGKLSMRQRMEDHRTAPQCAVCHKIMDPIGFALENLDGIGKWRDLGGDEGTEPIDPSGILPDGSAFDGPAGLRDVLVKRQDMFVENFVERLLTYAMGRGVEEYDRPVIRRIAREAGPDDKWSAIILSIVKSKPFQMIQTGERGA